MADSLRPQTCGYDGGVIPYSHRLRTWIFFLVLAAVGFVAHLVQKLLRVFVVPMLRARIALPLRMRPIVCTSFPFTAV